VIDHLGEDTGLDALVAVMSRFHCVRTFREATGQTPHRYLTSPRMRRLADRPRITGLSVRRIGPAYGYQGPSRFAAGSAVDRPHSAIRDASTAIRGSAGCWGRAYRRS
jgi:methylphosphotriester-DNA--protein-cysteine methyltransferase